MIRRVLVVILALAAMGAMGADALARYDRVTIAPTSTSIYIGSVSMTMSPFDRQGGTFEATYDARVFPYFFFNEHGRLRIPISNEQLQALARGEAIDFSGEGTRSDGTPRRVEGRATPFNDTQGKIKVRVFVSKHVQLIFNTTYRAGG
jgi:hypothetical protein